jgi:hypothetical protein
MAYDSYQAFLDAAQKQQANQGNMTSFRLGLGGPVGWYEVLSGGKREPLGLENAIFGDPADARGMNKAVFESMGPEDWDAYNKMSDQERFNFASKRSADIMAGKAKGQAAQNAEQSKLDQLNAAKTELINKVKAFADEMNMPVDELMKKDGFAQALNSSTFSRASTDASNRGLGLGGISNANADFATKQALLGYQFQRQQAGANALQNAFNMTSQQGATNEDIRRYEQGMNLQLQQAQAARQAAQYQQGLSQRQGMGSLAGGIIGGVYGGPSGAAFGSQIGGSIAGSTYGTYKPYQYSYPSGNYGGSASGLSSNSYSGGNY